MKTKSLVCVFQFKNTTILHVDVSLECRRMISSSFVVIIISLPPSGNKPIYRSMENLNSSSAFQGLDNHRSTGGGRFPTLPLSGFTFTPNSATSPSGHLMVPGSPAAFTAHTVPRNPRVVPMITRSQSSSNLPENLTENPYDEVGGGFSSHINHRMPKKSCSQWDMVGASGKKNHLQVGRGLQIPNMCYLTAEGSLISIFFCTFLFIGTTFCVNSHWSLRYFGTL